MAEIIDPRETAAIAHETRDLILRHAAVGVHRSAIAAGLALALVDISQQTEGGRLMVETLLSLVREKTHAR